MGIFRSRSLWLSTSSLCAAALGMAAPVCAQEIAADVSQTDSSDEPEDIVVTGQRAADRNAIQNKRNSVQIVDSISADDIGQMADFSIGDALKRIAGVNTYNYQGEPRFATIRGFNSNYLTTTLDGLQIASPDNQNQSNGGGRQFYLESLPSNIASRIEVFKSSTPDMAGHSVGGAVNFAIPSAFDFREDQISISAKGGVQLLDSKYGGNRPTYQGEGFITQRFGSDRELGITLSGSYWRREQWIPQAEQGGSANWYNANGTRSSQPYVGNGPVGGERRWMLYDNNRERGSVVGKFDYRPTGSSLTASLTGFYFTQHEASIRHDTLASFGNGAIVTNQTENSGTISPRTTAAGDIQSSVRTYALYFTRKTYGGQGNIGYEFSDDLKFDIAGGYSRATARNPQISDNFVQNGLAYNYTQNSDGVFVSPVNSARYNTASLYIGGTGTANAQHMEELHTTDADHYEAKARLSYNMASADRGFGMEGGVSYISNIHDQTYIQNAWNGMPYTLADVISSERLCALNCNEGGLFLIDDARLRSTLDRFLPTVTPVENTANRFARSFGVEENVTSAFLTARYFQDDWSVVGGLRLENTDFSTNGFQARTTRVGTANVINYEPITARSNYDHWLPSIIASYSPTENIKLRAGYSRTIGRPKFTDMGLLGGALNVSDINNPVLATGNPDLQPREADNFDVSLEWYFDQSDGLLSIAAFHKAVKGEIYLLGQRGLIDVGGGTMVQGTITTPVNSTETTTVDGIEFNLVKYFDFLPGFLSNFGVNANGIFSKAKFPIQLRDGTRQVLPVLPNQARRVINLALFYETEKFHARVAWNHTGSFLDERQLGTASTNAASFYRNRWTRPANFIDASISYDVSDRLSVRIDGTNLTGQGTDTNMGIDQEIPVVRSKIPAAILAGFSYRF